MICRFGRSIGSGLFQFELILLKIPLAIGVTSTRSVLAGCVHCA